MFRIPALLTIALVAGLGVRAEAPDAATPAKPPDTGAQAQRLRRELEALSGKERSVLDELRRLETEARLRQLEEREATARITELTRAIEAHGADLARLEAEQADRGRYLAFRMREMYKRGPAAPLRLFVQRAEVTDAMRGLRYASLLTGRDGRVLRAYRDDRGKLEEDRDALVRSRDELDGARGDAEHARAELERSRAEQARYLAAIRRDRQTREDALRDLESASRELGGLTGRVSQAPAPTRDASSRRGHLAWPVEGKVSAGFGKVVHPQFKTVVPHPGLDFEVADGTDFHAVESGSVVYSAWLRGYGLTAIVDHGGGLLSVYAHAAALLVEQGQSVERGETLGKVGDTGSLRGAYLYFELRQEGKPVDPAPWLERR